MKKYKFLLGCLIIGFSPIAYSTQGSLPVIKSQNKNSCSCSAGDFRVESGKAKIHLEYPKNTRKKFSKNDQEVYAAPSCWTITNSSYTQQHAMGPHSYGWSETPANYNFISSQEFNQIHSSLNNYIVGLDIPDTLKADLKIQLTEYLQSYQSEVSNLSTSHGTIKHTASVTGAGIFNGRTIYEGSANLVLKCVPSTLTGPSDLENGIKSLIEETADNSSSNDTGKPIIGKPIKESVEAIHKDIMLKK